MKSWWLSNSFQLWLALSLSGCLSVLVIVPVSAQVKSDTQPLLVQSSTPQITPATEIVPITGVKANPTDKGVEIILETTAGTQLQVTNRSAGNNFIVDVSGGQLRLPSGNTYTFGSEKPLAGITQITVTNIDASTVRVTVVGVAAIPTVELFDDDAGLVFAVASTATATSPQQPPQTPQANQPLNQTQPKPSTSDEPIELVVTGEQDTYQATDGSTATKTDTPLRDIPQSIQVIPTQVLQDQQARNLAEAVRNVPGVAQGDNSPTRGSFEIPLIRGFDSRGDIQRNGLRDTTYEFQGFDTAGLERVEVLKGPASVLYGQGSLGGVINYVTKQPLSEPYAAVEASAGSFNFYRGAIDLSGPLNPSKTVLYRLNLAGQTTESFLDFYDQQRYFVAPVVSWQISDRTKVAFSGEYQVRPQKFGQIGIPAEGSVLPNPNGTIPRDRNISEPYATIDTSALRFGYDLEHRFSSNWQLRNAFGFSSFQRYKVWVYSTALEDDERTLDRNYQAGRDDLRSYNVDTYVVGKFATGSIRHQLVTGVNFTKFTNDVNNTFRPIAALDLFDPVYGSQPGPITRRAESFSSSDALGIYVQDQVTLADNLKLVLGGRFDTFSEKDEDRLNNTEETFSDDAFSPRVGLVYQPIPAISLYANYSRSFTPNTGTAFDGSTFQPERGTSYEVGIKGDIGNRLSATLAYYDLTRSNVLTTDPQNPDYSIQTGEQGSKGVELSLAGEILPGWNIITGYAYTDATITKDNDLPVGNLLNNVPKHRFNLWTKYEIQSGGFKGFGFGLGLFYVGERQGDLENTFTLPSYFLTEAAIFYKRDRLRAAVNFKNLFDVDYFDSALNRRNLFYGDPFTVQGTISWEF
ncbi:TonB-dependent receptor [Nostoc sp. PA-18-2419]|uniref:TonB-dependent receptor n=1 Tax=Nostoc sp. PA-18-2419 TaxID=2575443 RepID=UPI0011086032|nr:TonB-dependent receptor [Nostoc sp. PA-18-2419]